MARFRRRSTASEAQDAAVDEVTESTDEAADDAAPADTAETPSPAYDRAQGPFDESEADNADQELPRLDLGSLRIPGLPGLGVQIEADEATQQVQAVTAVAGESAVQLRAFAAPRSEGLWEELRAETLADIRSTAGTKVTDAVGPFGPELRAILPARSPEGQQIRQPVRFAGIDGPRWFLQVVFLGKAAVEATPNADLVRLVRETIVVRGTEAMAPRQLLTLTLPETPLDADDSEASGDEPADDEHGEPTDSRYTGIDPFERGPEITEVR